MFDQLKVIELLRYNVNTNVERVSDRIIQVLQNSSNSTFSAVLATGFSLISGDLGGSVYYALRSTDFAKNIVKGFSDENWRHVLGIVVKSFVVFLVFLIIFAISYSIVKYSRVLLINMRAGLKTHKDNDCDIKHYIDDFDHTACDALLFADDFLTKSKNIDVSNDGDIDMKRFYLYEAIYYLRKAQSITKDIFTKQDRCVGSAQEDKVEKHRLSNAVELMKRLSTDISKESRKLDISGEKLGSLNDSLSNVENNMTTLENSETNM